MQICNYYVFMRKFACVCVCSCMRVCKRSFALPICGKRGVLPAYRCVRVGALFFSGDVYDRLASMCIWALCINESNRKLAYAHDVILTLGRWSALIGLTCALQCFCSVLYTPAIVLSLFIACGIAPAHVWHATAGYLSFGPMAQCIVHALKGLACRSSPSHAR